MNIIRALCMFFSILMLSAQVSASEFGALLSANSDMVGVGARYNVQLEKNSLEFQLRYFLHGSTYNGMVHDARVDAGYRWMPFDKYLYMAAGAEYTFIYFDRTSAPFSSHKAGAFGKIGVKSEGSIYFFADYMASWFFLTSNGYKNSRHSDTRHHDEKKEWNRSENANQFFTVGVGYKW